MSVITVRKKPVEVQAIQWTGANIDEIFEFTGCDKFDLLDEQQRRDGADPDATAAVFDVLHSTWVLVYDGQWIIRGVKGEFYPCAADVFAETYEQLTGRDPWAADDDERDEQRSAATPDGGDFADGNGGYGPAPELERW
jgi:hypothetical protein